MDVQFSADVEEYAAATQPFLALDPVRGTILLTVTSAIRDGIAQFETTAFSWVTDGDAVIGAAFIGRDAELLLSVMSDQAAHALAEAWADSTHPVSGVTGPRPAAEQCARQLGRRTGQELRERFPERLFRLDAVTPPRRPDGRARLAVEADADIAVEWFVAFAEEAGVAPLPDIRRGIDFRLATGRLWLWDNVGAVSLVSVSPSVCGVSRLGPVYTPRELRGRGYARALVAVSSQARLDAGDAACCLFTDLTNPVSNAIYQQVGYRAVGDYAQFELRPASR